MLVDFQDGSRDNTQEQTNVYHGGFHLVNIKMKVFLQPHFATILIIIFGENQFFW